MKRYIKSSYDDRSSEYTLEVVPEGNDDNDNPTCWALKFHDDNKKEHYIWISFYEDEYIVEDAEGNNLAGKLEYKTLAGATRKAKELAKRQQMKGFFTN